MFQAILFSYGSEMRKIFNSHLDPRQTSWISANRTTGVSVCVQECFSDLEVGQNADFRYQDRHIKNKAVLP